MTIGAFYDSLQRAENLLRSVEFLRQKGVKKLSEIGVSPEFRSASQKLDYFATYKTGLRNLDYDFLLFDESFLQFEFTVDGACAEVPSLRYAFFQNPQEYKSYEDFIVENELLDEGMTIDDLGDTFIEEYEQFALEQQISTNTNTVRYDTDLPNYRPLVHSVSHIHIGYSNDVRIPCDKLLTPEKFVLFVIKHSYYHQWKSLVENNHQALIQSLGATKGGCTILGRHHWADLERQELFLT